MPLLSGMAARELIEFGRSHVGFFRYSGATSAFDPGDREPDMTTFTRASRPIIGRSAADPE